MAKVLSFVDDTNVFENALNSWAETIVPGPGQIVVGGVDGTPLPLMAGDTLARGNRVIGLGDSLIAGGGDLTQGWYGATSFVNVACICSDGRLRLAGNAGVGGQTTSQVLARVHSDVIAAAPAVCVLCAGINDIGKGVPLTTTQANLTAIVAALQAASIRPILCTVPPWNGGGSHPQIAALNTWIAGFAAQRGLALFDLHALAVDAATGNWQSGYSGDQLHPNAVGTRVLAQAFANQISPLVPPAFPHLTDHLGDATNLLTNGVFVGDANSDGVADNWAVTGLDATATPSLVADSAIAGNWQRIAVTGPSGLRTLTQLITTGFAPGDRLAFSGRLTTSGLEAGGLWVTPSVVFNADAIRPSITPYQQGASDLTGVFYAEGVVPVGATSCNAQLQCGSTGTGTVSVAQFTVLNLTALGLA